MWIFDFRVRVHPLIGIALNVKFLICILYYKHFNE